MKRCFALLVTAALICIGFNAMASNGPAEVKFENKRGTVTFNHQQHQAANECSVCHHKGMETPACRSCHDGTKAPDAKTVFHKLCKECHKNSGSEKVKGNCTECHQK